MAPKSTEHRLSDVAAAEHRRADCAGFPVASPTEWQQFLALPIEEQRPHLQAHSECLNAVLDGMPDPFTNPLPGVPIVCVACKDVWCCRCTERNVHRLCKDKWLCHQPYWDCRSQTWRPRSRSPPPPPPGIVFIQQLGLTENKEKKLRQAEVKNTKMDPRSGTTASGKVASSAAGGGSSRITGPQTDLEAVMARLDKGVLRLERTKPMLQLALEDLRMQVWLSPDTDYVRHVRRVVDSLPHHMNFKVGITVCPEARYYHARYAYCLPSAQERDGVRYEGMIIVYVHAVRDVVGMMEHTFIHILKVNVHLKSRVANVKVDFDNHIEFDHSDEETEAAPGPHSFYIVWGPPIPKCR